MSADATEPELKQEKGHGRGLSRLLRRRSRRPGAPPVPVPLPAPDPVASSRRPRPLPPLDDFAPTPFERAVARFNAGEAGRTVAGLVRTLGPPRASVGASAGAPGEVRITVAWELSWYQWGVDVGDELRPVFEIAKGGEVEQLDAAARQWNAAVSKDGKLRLSS